MCCYTVDWKSLIHVTMQTYANIYHTGRKDGMRPWNVQTWIIAKYLMKMWAKFQVSLISCNLQVNEVCMVLVRSSNIILVRFRCKVVLYFAGKQFHPVAGSYKYQVCSQCVVKQLMVHNHCF